MSEIQLSAFFHSTYSQFHCLKMNSEFRCLRIKHACVTLHRLVTYFFLKIIIIIIPHWFFACHHFPSGLFLWIILSVGPYSVHPPNTALYKVTENYSNLTHDLSPEVDTECPISLEHFLFTTCLYEIANEFKYLAFGVKSQILNENLIGDLMKNHFIRSLVWNSCMFLQPQERVWLPVTSWVTTPQSAGESEYNPNLCNQVHSQEAHSRMCALILLKPLTWDLQSRWQSKIMTVSLTLEVYKTIPRIVRTTGADNANSKKEQAREGNVHLIYSSITMMIWFSFWQEADLPKTIILWLGPLTSEEC